MKKYWLYYSHFQWIYHSLACIFDFNDDNFNLRGDFDLQDDAKLQLVMNHCFFMQSKMTLQVLLDGYCPRSNYHLSAIVSNLIHFLLIQMYYSFEDYTFLLTLYQNICFPFRIKLDPPLNLIFKKKQKNFFLLLLLLLIASGVFGIFFYCLFLYC